MDTQERKIENENHAPTTIRRKGRKVHVRNYSPQARTISEGVEEMKHDIQKHTGGPNGQRITFRSEEAAERFTKYVGRF